jgi:hypothetical protein
MVGDSLGRLSSITGKMFHSTSPSCAQISGGAIRCNPTKNQCIQPWPAEGEEFKDRKKSHEQQRQPDMEKRMAACEQWKTRIEHLTGPVPKVKSRKMAAERGNATHANGRLNRPDGQMTIRHAHAQIMFEVRAPK